MLNTSLVKVITVYLFPVSQPGWGTNKAVDTVTRALDDLAWTDLVWSPVSDSPFRLEGTFEGRVEAEVTMEKETPYDGVDRGRYQVHGIGRRT